MIVTLYHGSRDIVVQPQYGAEKSKNDYGQGFYTTRSSKLAEEWAAQNCTHIGYVNIYKLGLDSMNIFELQDMLAWIAVLIKNRRLWEEYEHKTVKRFMDKYYDKGIDRADVVVGLRADDNLYAILRDFITSGLSLEGLEEAFKLGNLGKQYFIKSKKAFSSIRFMGSREVERAEIIERANAREARALLRYMRMQNKRRGSLIEDLI